MEDSQMAEIIAKAKDNERLMDGTTGPVKRIIDGAEIVYGVWPDASNPQGFAWYIIKGVRLLESVAKGGRASLTGGEHLSLASRRATWNAIPCESYEHAVAIQQTFGEPED